MKPVVIIVTYNGMRWLDKCLSSIRNSDIDLETVIVDNGSIDGTTEFIEEFFFEMTLIKSTVNLGFGKANNIGLKKARELGAKYVYLMNQDAWIESNTVSELIAQMEANLDFGILSPIQLTGRGDVMDANFLKFTASKIKENRFLLDIEQNNVKTLYEVPFVMAAHWLINLEYISKIGGFSHAFPHYGEDHNLIHRFKYFNFKTGICPMIRAYHDREFRRNPVSKRAYNSCVVLSVKLNDINKQGYIYFIQSYLFFVRHLIGQVRFRVDLIFNSLYKSFKIIRTASEYRRITRKEKGCFI